MTLGCKVNQADTASMQELFRQAGYEVCGFTEPADIYEDPEDSLRSNRKNP